MTFGAFRLNTLSAALASATNSITATGGTISYYSSGSTTYKLHTFTTTGSNSFIVSATTGTPTTDILLVGGGGAGGGVTTAIGGGGGGGGGAVVYQTGIAITAQTYTISVGAGGTGISSGSGNAGTASTGLTYTANGGGAGTTASAATNGGGSGACGSTTSYTSTAGTYAFKGGNGFGSATSSQRQGGGGAGAGAAGTDAAISTGGNGGIGVLNTINGNTYYYAPGGGGGAVTSAAGSVYNNTGTLVGAASGNGGGAKSGGTAGYNNTTVYGGGGGGASNAVSTAAAGGNGNQGIAYVRYTVPYVASVAYVTSVFSYTSSLTFPTVQAGDIAIYAVTAANTTTAIPASVTPTGFTLLSSATVATTLGTRTEIFYKICTGSESASSLTNATGTSNNLTNMLIYRPSSTVNSLVFSTPSIQVTDAAPTNQTLTMTGLTGPYIGFAWGFTSGFGSVTSTGATKTRSSLAGSSGGWNTFEATSSSVSFSTATLSMTDTGTNSLASFTMKIY